MKRVLSCALILCLTTGALAATEPASLPEEPPAEDDSVQKSVDEVQGPAAIQLDEGTQIILPDSRAVRLKESWWLLNRPGTEKCASWADQAKQLSAELAMLGLLSRGYCQGLGIDPDQAYDFIEEDDKVYARLRQPVS